MARWDRVQKEEWTMGRRDSGELCLTKLSQPQEKCRGLVFIKQMEGEVSVITYLLNLLYLIRRLQLKNYFNLTLLYPDTPGKIFNKLTLLQSRKILS